MGPYDAISNRSSETKQGVWRSLWDGPSHCVRTLGALSLEPLGFQAKSGFKQAPQRVDDGPRSGR